MEYKTENDISYNIYDKLNIYLTGYGPFMTIKENPAEKISSYIFQNYSKLNTQTTNILYNQIFEVKTDYVDNNISKLFDIIKKYENNEEDKDKNILHIIISIGVAENRKVNTLEIRGKNYIYDRIVDKIIDENKPEYYYSKTPIKYIIKGIQNFNNSECKYSNDAGTYLCNYMYFTTLSKCFDEKNMCSFFLHIPTLNNYSIEKQEIFFKNFIDVLESLYLKGNEEKRKKILEYEIKEEDEHIDEWNM
jgi:pyroglutamyl-peptidase